MISLDDVSGTELGGFFINQKITPFRGSDLRRTGKIRKLRRVGKIVRLKPSGRPSIMGKRKVVILMGSKKDVSFTEPICRVLKKFGVNFDRRIASAHKTPEKVLEILKEHEGPGKIVYITVAGRTDALSGFVDANTKYPVIACPSPSDELGGSYFYSSLRPPSGVVPLVILEPEGAALAAVKILAGEDSALSKKIVEYQQKMKERINEDDQEIKRGKR